MSETFAIVSIFLWPLFSAPEKVAKITVESRWVQLTLKNGDMGDMAP
jgi:hypothetical protein